LARAYADRVEPFLTGRGVPAEAVRLAKEAPNPREAVNRVLTWMHDRVRYVSMAFGESAIIPAPPAETLKRAYGDCKDQATVLAATLRAAGIDAQLALLRTGPGEDVIPGLPALNVFDHAIVYVPGKDPFWVDPTSPYARAGELPVGDRGRLALVIHRGTTELVSTPAGDAKLDTYQEVREIHFSEYGKGRVVETTTAGGALEQELRSNFSGTQDGIKKSLREYVEKTYGSKELGSVSYGSTTQVTVPYELKLEAKESSFAYTGLLSAHFTLNEGILWNWLPRTVFEDEPRDLDLVVPMPYTATVKHLIRAPKHFTVKPIPAQPPFKLGPVEITRTFAPQADGSLEAATTLRTLRQRWSAEDLKQFRAGVKRWEGQQAPVLELEHRGQALVDGNQLAQGLSLFQRDVSAAPESAVAQMRLAITLVDAGFGMAAREAARRAVAAAPNDADMHAMLAVVLQRDEFGRALHAGYDRAGAIAELRRAAELEPDEPKRQLDLAVLLEYDERGRRYTRRASLDEAIKGYDSVDRDKLLAFDGGSYAVNPPFALFYAGRFQEALQRAQQLPAERQPHGLHIAAITAQSGPLAGVAEADRLSLRGEQRSESFAVASDMLAQLRRYPEAAALAEAALAGAKQPGNLQVRIKFLRSASAVDPDRMATRTPEEVLKKLFVSAATGRELPEALVAQAARKKDSGVRNYFEGVRDAFRAGPLEPETAGDAAAASFKYQVRGDDKVGWSVEAAAENGQANAPKSRFFLLQEEKAVRVRSAGNLAEVAEQALEDLGSGNVARAKAWLAWAREGVYEGTSDDPLARPAWLRLYEDGKGNLELAAAALCGKKCEERGARVLEQARAKAQGEAAVTLDLALAGAYGKDGTKLLAVAQRLKQTHPNSKTALYHETRALLELKRYSELEQILQARLTQARDDEKPALYQVLSDTRALAGKLKEAMEASKAILDLGRADAGTYNNLAWCAVFAGQLTDENLAHALRAAQTSGFSNLSSLHTLAVFYAETGKLKEAGDALTRILNGRTGQDPDSVDWYIIGRIAEHLHLTAEAKRAYQRVEKPEQNHTTSTYNLAQARLARAAVARP
jgi:hypothetical protein